MVASSLTVVHNLTQAIEIENFSIDQFYVLYHCKDSLSKVQYHYHILTEYLKIVGTQPANIGPQDVPRTSPSNVPRTSPKDPI